MCFHEREKMRVKICFATWQEEESSLTVVEVFYVNRHCR